MLDPQRTESELSHIETHTVEKLAEDANEVYTRLRALEKDTQQKSVSTPDFILPFNASFPLLIQPFQNTDSSIRGVLNGLDGVSSGNPLTQAVRSYEKKMNEIMLHLLDKWVEAENKRAEEQQRKKPQLEREDFEKYLKNVREFSPLPMVNLYTLPVALIVTAAAFPSVGAIQSASTGAVQSIGLQEATILPVIQGAVYCAAGAIPQEMRGELSFLGAIWGNLTSLQAALFTVAENQKGEGKPLDWQFAALYAQRLIKMVNDPGFNTLLQTAIQARSDGAVTPKEREQWLTCLKIGLLLSGLALFYKVETGWLTGEEVVWMLRDPDLAKAGAKAPLIVEAQKLLYSLPPVVREQLLMSLMNFLNSNPKIDSLMDPLHVLEGMLSGEEWDRKAAEHRSA